MLYENFNTTNQTSPRFARHENFVEPAKPLSCAFVVTLPESERCDFVKTSPTCGENQLLFSYNQLYFCNFKTGDRFSAAMGILLLIAICAYYFLMLAMLTDTFWCPALKTLSKLLHFNENVAGVTVVAFGNAAPDFFVTIAGMESKTRNSFSDTYASVIFVNAFVAGAIIVLSPFVVEPAYFLRDVSFSLLYVVYMDYVIKTENGIITRTHAVVMMTIYVLYIGVVVIDHWLLLRKKRDLERHVTETGEEDADLKRLNSLMGMTAVFKFTEEQVTYETANTKLKEQFLHSVNPLDMTRYRESSHIGKLYLLLRVPIKLSLCILIPYVNCEVYNYGWSKLLCCLQFIITPCFIAWVIFGSRTIYGCPPFVFLLPFVIPISYFIFTHSRTDRHPRYYKFVSILSVLVTMFVIYANAAETLVMLDVLGIAMHRSDALIGSTLLSWGSCIGDLITDIMLLKQGLPRMAFAACFGSPIFSCFCSMGLTLLYKTFNSNTGTIILTEGTVGENSSIFLIIFLIAMLLYGTTTNFMMRRCCGVFNIIYYSIYLMYNFLNEFEIVHAYGTDHKLDKKFEDND